MFGRKMKLACVALTMAALGCAAPPCRAGAGEQDNLAHLPRREKIVRPCYGLTRYLQWNHRGAWRKSWCGLSCVGDAEICCVS